MATILQNEGWSFLEVSILARTILRIAGVSAMISVSWLGPKSVLAEQPAPTAPVAVEALAAPAAAQGAGVSLGAGPRALLHHPPRPRPPHHLRLVNATAGGSGGVRAAPPAPIEIVPPPEAMACARLALDA